MKLKLVVFGLCAVGMCFSLQSQAVAQGCPDGFSGTYELIQQGNRSELKITQDGCIWETVSHEDGEEPKITNIHFNGVPVKEEPMELFGYNCDTTMVPRAYAAHVEMVITLDCKPDPNATIGDWFDSEASDGLVEVEVESESEEEDFDEEEVASEDSHEDSEDTEDPVLDLSRLLSESEPVVMTVTVKMSLNSDRDLVMAVESTLKVGNAEPEAAKPMVTTAKRIK